MSWLLKCALIIITVLGMARPAMANEDGRDPDDYFQVGGQRVNHSETDCQRYHWEVISWETGQPICSFYTSSKYQPSASAVKQYCGASIVDRWYASPQISPAGDAPDHGLYLMLDHIAQTSCKIASHLPSVKFTHQVEGKFLYITAAEPMPGHEIQRIEGYYGSHPFECPGSSCEVQIIPTGQRGVEIWYRAHSTYEDHPTPKQFLYIRSSGPDDIQIIDEDHGSTAQQIWGAFADDQQPWLAAGAQASSEGLAYLAGRLIAHGHVDASSCPGSGLMFNGYANICGLNEARPMVNKIQNQYDDQINEAAAAEGIPGQLIKRLIRVESQFWDGPHLSVYTAAGEAGLGQLTHNGADTLLMWHSQSYDDHCWPIYGDQCKWGYNNLARIQQQTLQNQVMVDPGIQTIARSLVANAGQAGAIVRELTDKHPGAVLSYEDLWKLALINYSAGAGCLRAALVETIDQNKMLQWGIIQDNLNLYCPTDYIENIINN